MTVGQARPDSEARLQALLSSLDDLVFELDEEGTYLGIWTADDALLAAPRGEMLGRTLRDVTGDEIGSQLTGAARRVLETGCPETCEYSLKVPAGTRWFEGRLAPIAVPKGLQGRVCLLVRDITAQKLTEEARYKAEARLRHQALHDGLTGLANRLVLIDRLSQAVLALERNPGRVGLFLVDLDKFKAINDAYGHLAGDQVLVEVGRRLSRICRRGDTVARFEGDEFALLAGSLGGDDDLCLLADRAVRAIGEPFVPEGIDLSVTSSVGVVVTTDPLADPDTLLREAETALFAAKSAGRDGYRVFDAGLQAYAMAEQYLDAALRNAIDNKELFLVYQPLFSLMDRSICGVEALVRWRHPDRGIVPPGDFIPLAEERGLIGAIDAFVFDEACRQLAQWAREEPCPDGFTMAVNLSGRQLADPMLVERVASTMGRHGVEPSQVCLEVTETALVGELGLAATTLAALSGLGAQLALDDFGTGYSSLAHVQRLNVDSLKIDRSFVEQIAGRERDRQIIAAIIAMAHALGMAVVGEGIETDLQSAELASLGCDFGQGFLLARPMAPEQVSALFPAARDTFAGKWSAPERARAPLPL